jgi:hypothetical protein
MNSQTRALIRAWTQCLACLVSAAWLVCVLSSGAVAASDALRYENPGPYQVEVLRRALCCDRTGDAVDLYLPTVPAGSTPAPVVTWEAAHGRHPKSTISC